MALSFRGQSARSSRSYVPPSRRNTGNHHENSQTGKSPWDLATNWRNEAQPLQSTTERADHGSSVVPNEPSLTQEHSRTLDCRDPAPATRKAQSVHNNPQNPQSSALTKTPGNSLRKEDWKAGLIILALHVEEAWSETKVAPDQPTFQTAVGLLCGKERPMIVVTPYADHYLAVLIFTYHGHGLQFKPNKDESVSLRDHRLKGDFNAQSIHAPLVTVTMRPTFDPFDPTAAACLTYPVARKCSLLVVVMGKLGFPSTEWLLELYCRFTPKWPTANSSTKTPGSKAAQGSMGPKSAENSRFVELSGTTGQGTSQTAETSRSTAGQNTSESQRSPANNVPSSSQSPASATQVSPWDWNGKPQHKE